MEQQTHKTQVRQNATELLGFVLLIISALTSVSLHAYLTLRHVQLQLGTAPNGGLCQFGTTFDCDAVAISPYAELFNIPVAVWGMAINLGLLLLVIRCWRFRKQFSQKPQLPALLSLITLGIFLTSIVMAGISHFLIGKYCLFCLFLYGFSALSLIGTRLFTKKSFLRLNLFAGFRDKLGLLILAMTSVFILVGFTTGLHFTKLRDLPIAISQSLNSWQKEQAIDVDYTGLPYFGSSPEKARVVILEYADYQCPHCQHVAPRLKSFVSSRADVSLVFAPFPLDESCNTLIKGRKGNLGSCLAAKATLCAENQKQGWLMHDILFEQASLLRTETTAQQLINTSASALNLNSSSFAECMINSDVQNKLNITNEPVAKSGMTGTPGIFVQKRYLVHGQYIPILEAAEQAARSEKK